jgi:hypothetical protein
VKHVALVVSLLTFACSLPPAVAGAQESIVMVSPFCDSTTVGAPAGGFHVTVNRSDVTLTIANADGTFSGPPFVPPPAFTIAESFPPGIGVTTFTVRALSSGAVLQTLMAPDPCAPPTPTSKDQCKDDGWRQYGFKNQGHCIASLNRPNRAGDGPGQGPASP